MCTICSINPFNSADEITSLNRHIHTVVTTNCNYVFSSHDPLKMKKRFKISIFLHWINSSFKENNGKLNRAVKIFVQFLLLRHKFAIAADTSLYGIAMSGNVRNCEISYFVILKPHDL